MIQADEKAIRDRAYAIWEREGRPSGRERDHWLQAAWELSGEEARSKARAKPTAKAGGKPKPKAAKAPSRRSRKA